MSDLLVNLAVVFSKPTGISNYAKNLFLYLKTLNPTLLTTQKYAEFSCHLIPDNLTPDRGTKGHFNRLIWTQFHLPPIYKKRQSKLLFSPIPEAPIYTDCRFIVMVHDLIPLRFPKRFSPLTPYFRYYIPQVLDRAEHIICNSTATAKDITNFYGIPSTKITPILLAYDANHYRRLNLPSQDEQPPYFLYLGRHDPYKNLDRLIAAFAKISDGDCQLWLAGPSDKRYTPKLQAQVQELSLGDRVKFLDYVPYERLPLLLNQALALVFPSLWEGFGLPVLEAMACGTPVITSNLSSLPEVAGSAALLIDPYNVGELAEAMQAVVEDEELRSRLSSLSLKRSGQFSWEKTGKATVEVLQRYL
ncbi:MAG: glycosyltransferase family 4 protein [Hydrococcus sp. RU_2_2]|nr:glycosyltransferase family 4 protein [Hydrococcus sp. RU_2_2]NJP22351.1 glycosyltransferase family 4 protein [Hydrococcus sp. CRU_1_1]